MNSAVADTHGLIWHLTGANAKIGKRAKFWFEGADRGERLIWISSISLLEMVYLSERKKPPISDAMVRGLMKSIGEDTSYRVASITKDVAEKVRSVPRDAISDMPDRVIVATALRLGCPLLSADERISGWPGIETVWD